MRRFFPFACLLTMLLFPIPLFAQEEGNDAPVYVIPLQGDVDRQLGVFLAQSLQTAQDAGASTVIFEIDTFGGRVDTALEIAGRIGTTEARTIAYIPAGGKGVSWSAGALMAFSCSEIWMAPGTSMGAAAPVYQTTEGMQSAEEKTVSAVRGQMAALAEKNGHPEAVALAMVDADVVLKEVVVDGESRLATGEDIEAYRAQGSVVEEGRILCDEGKLLTLTAGQMERYDVASGLASNREDLASALGFDSSRIIEEVPSGADSFVAFLTSAGVTGILLAVGLVALYLEITSPGFGIPGTIALLCFALVFGASGLLGNLGSVEILMFLAGAVLLLLEIFIIPGFGVAGIGGIILILSSLVFSMQDFYWPELDWQWQMLWRNLAIVGFGLLGGIALIAVLMSFLPRVSLFDRLVLHGPGDPGYGGTPRLKRKKKEHSEESHTSQASPENPGVVGEIGEALTSLRPVGKARFGNSLRVVETTGEFLEKNTELVIVAIDGIKTVVAAHSAHPVNQTKSKEKEN